MSGLVPEPDESSYELQCFPLYSLILALGNPTINYFSLDIEGSEFLVRMTVVLNIFHPNLDLPGSEKFTVGQGGHRSDHNRVGTCWEGI